VGGNGVIEPQLLRKPDAAKFLSMSESTLEKMTCRRQIPHVKSGRSVYYDVADLLAWIASKKIPATVASPVAP
jgi:excisionase family DNA binding protein